MLRRTKTICLYAGLGLAMLCQPSSAQDMTARQLLGHCLPGNGPQELLCRSYLAGFADGLQIGATTSFDMTKGLACIPPGSVMKIIRPLAEKFLSQNPDVLDEPARLALGVALIRNFPCGR
jgi:hypothetical protein